MTSTIRWKLGLVIVAACGGGRAPSSGLGGPGGPPAGGAPPVSRASTMQGQGTRVFTPASEEVTIDTDGRATVLGLDIVVVENIEKLDLDGTTFMRVQLHVRDERGEGDVHLSSETVQASWQGWRFDYLGGWREHVQLRVTRPPVE